MYLLFEKMYFVTNTLQLLIISRTVPIRKKKLTKISIFVEYKVGFLTKKNNCSAEIGTSRINC